MTNHTLAQSYFIKATKRLRIQYTTNFEHSYQFKREAGVRNAREKRHLPV